MGGESGGGEGPVLASKWGERDRGIPNRGPGVRALGAGRAGRAARGRPLAGSKELGAARVARAARGWGQQGAGGTGGRTPL